MWMETPFGWIGDGCSGRDCHDEADETYYLNAQQMISQPLGNRVDVIEKEGDLARTVVNGKGKGKAWYK